MPYASCLASCSVGWRYSVTGLILRNSACPWVLSLMELCLSPIGLLQPFLFRVFHIAPRDSLSGLCALWDSLSSFPRLLLGRCTLGWPVWPVIGVPLLGVHPSISIVKLIMIGYCCNHLDGQLNCWVFAHWLIGVTIMYQLCYWQLGSSTPCTYAQHPKAKLKIPCSLWSPRHTGLPLWMGATKMQVIKGMTIPCACCRNTSGSQE